MIKPKRTAEEYEQSKLGGGKSGNSNSGGSSGLITPKRTASEFEGYKRGDDAWYSSDEQIRPSTGSSNVYSRLAEAARLKAEGEARKVGRLYSIYSRRLRDASAAAQASSARQRYDYYDQQYQALQEQKTGATALAGIGARDLDGKGSEKLKKLKEQRDKWAGYVAQIEAGKTPEIESTPYADWMYAINTDQYGKAAAQGQAQLTQEAIDRRGNYTRNELEAMRDREAAQGNDIMVNAYDAAIGAKADDAKLGVVEAIRRTQGYKDYTSPRTPGKAVKVDGLTVDSDLYMTPTERKTYDYLFDNGAKFGISAGEYYSLLRPTLERRQAQIQEQKNRQMVESGVIGAVAANAGRVGANLLAGTGYVAALVDALGGGEVTTDKPYFAMGRMADTVRDETRQQITNGIGGGFGADAAAFAYDTGMSIADFVASYYATGGGALGKIGEAAMLTLMGTKAAESTTRDSLERGATQGQALVNGAAAGIAEVLFEKLSIENFETVKSAMNSSSYIKRVLSQAGVEASEEMCTEIANILTDRAIMGDKSEYEATVEQYRAQGMTLAEAEAQANLDMAKRVGLSGLGGFISGGVTGSFAAAMSAGERSKLGKYVLNNDAALFDTLSYARFRGAEQAGQIATDLADGKITYDEARKAYKGKTRDLGGIFAQMVGDAYATQVARGMTPNAQLGTNPTADDIIAYSNAMFAERANAPIETETETQPQEQAQPDRLMLAAQQAAQGQTESVPADLESAARQSVERQEAQRQERRVAQIRQTQEQREAVREGIRTQLDGAVSPAAADTASAAYDGVSDVGAYIRATYAIDNAARAGQSLDSINSNIAAAIPEQTRTAIYNAAVSAYKAQNSVVDEIPAKAETTAETSAQTATDGDTKAEIQTATATKAQTDIATATEAQTVAEGQETSYTHDASTRGGLVYAEGVTPKSKAEANAAKALDIALKAVGITVNVKGENGVDVVLSDGTVKKGAAYGLYNKGNGEISTEGISLVTILHESVHKIGNEVSAEDWTAFKDAVISAARDAGVDVDAQRQSLEDAYSGIEDSAQSIDEEQIAYIVGQLADKPDLAEHFATRFIDDEQTKSLFKRLIDKIKELLGRIRDALTRRKYYKASEAIATDIDALDKVESAYFDALEKLRDGAAAENNATINAQDGVVITEQDGMKVGSLYSVKYLLNDKQRSKAENRIADKLGIDVSEVKSWLDAETSIASLVLNPKYSEFLDYEADPSETAIKKNSDYPQGTVDFSNVCPKRRDLTNVMGIVMRKFPNHIFTSEDVADTINILKDSGLNFPCSACFVEDRRQNDFGIAQNFLDSLDIYRNGGTIRPDGKPFNANQLKALALIKTDTYTPSIYELATLEGRNVLKEKDSAMEAAWKKFNNARGMQSARLLTNEAEYKRQIRRYSKRTVNNKNNRGGLRVYSFSDGEMYHLIDMIQIICDSSEVGLMLQGYSKQNKFVAAIKDTGVRLLRSCIPKGELGYKVIDGRAVLDFDTVEGIDINDEYFFDSSDNPYIGNNVIGVSDVQIRAAMRDDFIDQIIPFHTGQSEEVLKRKGIDGWGNYKDSQTEKDKATGKVSAHQVNFYTEVLEAAEKEGKPIKNKRDFVEKFLSVCKENGLIPRFSQFLNIDQNGEFVYTPGYEKFLVDFKMFAHDAEGTYIPLSGVKPIFDVALITQMLEEYVDERKAKDAEFEAKQPELLKKIEEKVINRGGNVYELKTADDAAYMEAVERGDMETAQQMVDKAAKAAGYTEEVYHGTQQFGFTRIDVSKSDDKLSFFATDDIKLARTYSGTRKQRNISNKFSLDIAKEDYTAKVNELIDTLKSEYSDATIDYSEYSELFSNLLKDAAVGEDYDMNLNFIRDDIEFALEFAGYSGKKLNKVYNMFNSLTKPLDRVYTLNLESSLGNYRFYANTERLLQIDAKGSNWTQIPFGNTVYNTRELAKYAYENGFDGVRIADVYDVGFALYKTQKSPSNVYIFLNPQAQLKSADPVTYDDNGDVIPLSKRFKSENPDIRFELKDPDDAAYRKLERRNTQLEKKVAALKQELKRTNGMVVKSGEARRVAAKIVKDYSSSYDKQTLEENLQKTFDFFAAKQEDGKTGLEHFEEAMPQLRAMARDIINRSSEPIAELEEFYKPIRDMLRKTKITPTPEQKAEIADWGKFVRENRGKIAIAKEGGVTVSTLYEKLVDADPDYFESDIPEEDMLPAIAEYVNNTAATTYANPFDEFMDEAVDGLAHEIVGEYLVAPKLKTFADKKFAEKEAALKRQGERLKAKTAAVRESYKAKLAEQKTKAAADKKKLRSDINERQKRKVIKSRIAQRLTKLNRWLKSPEKRAYVPQQLIKSATEAAQFVSEKLSRADYYDSRIPVLEAKIKNAKSAEQKLKYAEYLAKIRKQGDSARDKLNALINSYDEIITQMKQDEQDTTVKESVVDSIKDAREYLGDTAVNKMSSDQLKALEDVLKLVMSDIDYARKEFSGEKAKEAFDLGKRIADNLSEVQNKGDIAIAAKTLNGDRFLRRLGGYAKDNPFDALADKWTDGTRRKIAAERDLTGLFDDLVNDKAKMKQLKAMRDEKNAVELTVNGEKISLTHAEMINLYGQLNDEDALRHIIYGGETLRRDTKGQKTGRNRRIMPAKIDLGVRAAIEKNSELSGYDKEVLLNELDIEVMAQYEQLKRDIENKMTDYDRAWYKAIRKMFDSVSPALIDEQNLNEFGFRKATQPNYWRIETDKNFVSSEEAWSTLKYDANPANMGFMKKRIRGKKPIVLRDVTEFVDSYIRDTSTYVGMLAPSLYTKRVLSAQDPDRAWSVREALEVYGKTALGTINELMDDNIGLKANTGSMLMNRLRGGLAQSSLLLNPAVSVGQAASFFPAYPYLSAKELAKGLFVKPSSIPEEIMAKYSPYYWTRTKGYSLQQYADVGKDKMSEITQRGKAVLGWITGMDLFTVRRLWMAAEEQVKSDRPDLEIGTKEQIEKGESPFYKEVAKRYEEMLIRTQPVYAAQQRTGLARSKNEILRSFSMFRTVRDQNFGEVYEAIGRLHRYTQDAKTGAHGTTKEDVKAARKHLAKVIIGQLLSALMLVGLKEIAKLLLDHNADDFKDEYGEIDLGAAAGSLGINFLESLASNVLFGSDIYSLVKSMIDGSTYYGIDVNVTGIANDFLNSVRNITQNFNGTTVYNLAVSVSQILGVPLRNTVKMIEGAAESVNDIANGLAGTYASEFDRKNFRMTLDGITPSRLYKAIKDGDSARADKYREVLMGMVNDKGEKKYTTSDIDRAVAKLLAADDDRIKEAYEAKKSKNTETVEKLRGEIVADGFTRDMFNTAIDAYENSLKLEDDEEVAEEDKVLETSSYSTTELCDAILDGDKDAENGMIDVLKKEGKTGEQIKMNVKTDLKDRYQELYRAEGEKAAVELGKQIISKAGERYELSNYTINRWAAVVEACDNEDIAAANRKISLIKDKSELGYLKTTLSGYYKREYEVAINTEDKERQKELEKQMRNINLYDATTGERYFSSEKLSEWRKEFNF